jgi:hypothetical protein
MLFLLLPTPEKGGKPGAQVLVTPVEIQGRAYCHPNEQYRAAHIKGDSSGVNQPLNRPFRLLRQRRFVAL